MAFVKNLAKGGLFGLGGLAASGAFKKDKKPKPPLITGDYPSPPSLVNKSTIY